MSGITIEQVEKITARMRVTYEEARAALEQAGGDTLEAIIYLERQGKTPAAQPKTGAASACAGRTEAAGETGEAARAEASAGGFYSTRGSFGASAQEPGAAHRTPPPHGARDDAHSGARGRNVLESIWDILRGCFTNQFEVWRKGELMVTIPVVILIALVLIIFRISIGLLVIGLLCGCRYRFAGPLLRQNIVTDAMERGQDWIEKQVEAAKHRFAEGRKK